VVLILISVGLFVANRKEKERRNSQVKIWMQSSNGITQALERIISDKWRNYYSTVQDMANTIHAVHASSFALYQSLYEERAITEEEYKKEQAEIKEKAEEFQKESAMHSAKHSIFARGITLFQISIAIGAISIIVKRRNLWLVSMGFACVGIFFLIQGLLF